MSAAPATETPILSRRWTQRIAAHGIYAAFGLLLLALALVSPVFATPENLFNIALQSSINALLAFGMTFVILTAGIDLSVGSLLALSGAIAAGLMVTAGVPWPLAALCGLAAGTLLGAANGLAVTVFRIPPFIATLGMLSIGRGLTQLYTGGRPFTGLDPNFNALGQGELGPVPIPVVIVVLSVVLGWIVLRFDAITDALNAIKEGKMAATVAQQPALMGEMAVATANDIIAGKTPPASQPVEVKLVTKDNVDQFLK